MERDHIPLQMLYVKLRNSKPSQQLTAILIQSSTVNVMCHEEDCCVQCQESDHIAQHCPNVHCFKCDEYGHIVVDCLYHWILPLGTPAHPSQTEIPHQAPVTRTGTDTVRPRSQSHSCRYCSHSCHDSYRGLFQVTVIVDNRCHHRSTSQCLHSSTYHSHCETPHHRLSSHRSSSACSQDHSRS